MIIFCLYKTSRYDARVFCMVIRLLLGWSKWFFEGVACVKCANMMLGCCDWLLECCSMAARVI